MDWWFTSPFVQTIGKLISGKGSEAREKAKMYENIENELGKKINELERYLSFVDDNKCQAFRIFIFGGGKAEGLILTDYDAAVHKWNSKFVSILTNMNCGLNTLISRKNQVTQQRIEWELKAQAEEMGNNG